MLVLTKPQESLQETDGTQFSLPHCLMKEDVLQDIATEWCLIVGILKIIWKSVRVIFLSVLKHSLFYSDFFLIWIRKFVICRLYTKRSKEKKKYLLIQVSFDLKKNSVHTISEFLDFTLLQNRCVAFHLLGNTSVSQISLGKLFMIWGQ